MHWLIQNYQWLFDGFLGSVVLAVVGFGVRFGIRLWLKNSSNEETGESHGATLNAQGAKVALSPIASGSGIVQNVGTTHHHYYPYPVKSSKRADVAGFERLKPNIEFTGCREKRVFVSPFAQDGICEPRDKYDYSVQAFVLSFENKVLPDRKIGRALNVIAKIRFQSVDRVTERRINYGVWLNSPCASTDFGAGDTCELVLICVIENQLLTFEDRRTPGRSFSSEYSYLGEGSVQGLELVEIMLVDQNTQASLHCKFKIWRDGARFCLSETN
jgi:hypothetical protein